jgi:hypothetical protein
MMMMMMMMISLLIRRRGGKLSLKRSRLLLLKRIATNLMTKEGKRTEMG